MADNKEREEGDSSSKNELEEENASRGTELEEGSTPRGNGWEVVSLTASTYAAAPGPREVELKDDKERYAYGEDEISRAMFMSGHFVFPPSEHENLPLEPLKYDKNEIHGENVGEDVASKFDVQEGSRSSVKDGEDWNLIGLNVPNEYEGMKLSEEKCNDTEGATLQGLNLSDSSYGSEAELGESTMYSKTDTAAEMSETSERDVGFTEDIPKSPRIGKDGKHSSSDLPCDAWWKRRAVSIYAHAKETNTLWSVFIAAAVMGLVILGQRWQQERWQALQLKWQHTVKNEGCMMGSISRLKDVIVGGHRRGTLRGSASNE